MWLSAPACRETMCMTIMQLSGEVDRSVGADPPAQAAQLDALGVLPPLAGRETICGFPGRHDRRRIAQAGAVS